MVGQALERNARSDLEVKMAGMAHNLSMISDISGVNADAHQLVDLVMGHNNLYVSIFESAQSETPLLDWLEAGQRGGAQVSTIRTAEGT